MGIEGIASTSRTRAELKRSAGSPPRPFESRSARYDSSHAGAWPPPGKLRGIFRSSDGTPGPGLSTRPCLVRRHTTRGPPSARLVAPAGPRAGQATFAVGLRSSSGKLEDSQQKGGRPWTGRERGGHAIRPARRGTPATGSGGSPASWCSTTGQGTRPRPRRPAPGGPPPPEHDGRDRGVGRCDAGPGHPRRRRAPPRTRGRPPHSSGPGMQV
jgi:hypothetical protein